MKWIGQHIWDFVSRFRKDVYFEAVPDGTIASGKNLGLDSNNKLVKESDSGITDLHGAGVDGSANQILTDDGDGTVTSESNLTFASDILYLSSSSSSLPGIVLTNSNTDADPCGIAFSKTAIGANNDSIGVLSFGGRNDNNEPITFAQVTGSISSDGATDGDERGSFSVKVITTEGSSSLENGITLVGGTDGANKLVNVSLGAGTGSTTTLAGVADINGGVIRLGEGNSNDIYVKGFNTTSGNHGGSLYLQACQGNGTDKNGGSLQLKAGASTGSGNPGDFFFMSSTTGSSGSSTNGSFQSAALTSEGNLTIAGDLHVGGGNITNAVTFDSGLTGTLTGQADTVASIGNLTGDVTSSNRATTIADDAVTYAKMQNVTATDRILGRDSAGAGIVEEITPASLRTMINVEDGATADQTQADINGLAITTTGALDSGSITSGFGAIDNGSSSITTTGTVSGGELQVDDINLNSKTITLTGSTGDTCAIACGTNGATTITTVDTAGAQANLSLIADGNISLAGTLISAETDDFQISSTTDSHPALLIENGGNNSTGGELRFRSKRGNAGVNNDVLGGINFTGPNHDGSQLDIFYGQIIGSIGESNDDQESGKLGFYVAASDGATSSTALGLSMGGSSTDGTVSVGIGQGAASLTTVAGDLAIDGGNITTAVEVDGLLTAGANIRVGGSGRTSNNWITIDCQAGNDSSGGGITFYETSTDTLGSPRYGAKIVYNEVADEFAIGTMQNTTFMRQIYMPRESDHVFFADQAYIEGASPSLQFQCTDTSIVSTNSLGDLNWKSADDGGVTLRLKGIATETHSSNSAGGSKLEFHVTPNTTTATALAATIDQDKSLTVEGDLQVNGNLKAPTRQFDLPADGAGNANGDAIYIGLNDPSGGTGLTAGKIYYFKSSTGLWEEAQANSVSKSGPVLLGVALGTTPATHGVLLRGTVDLSEDITGTEAIGSVLYLDDVNAATATVTGPNTAGSDVVRIIGYSLSAGNANKIWFNPDSTFIEL